SRHGCVDARRTDQLEHRGGLRALGRRARRRPSRALRAPRVSALLGPAEIRDLAAALDLQPTKALGQKFVLDGNTVRKIARTAGVTSGEHVVEVGPGLGSLTLGLLEAGARVTAIEIDGRLAEQLPRTVEAMQPGAPLGVIPADALRVDGVAGDP